MIAHIATKGNAMIPKMKATVANNNKIDIDAMMIEIGNMNSVIIKRSYHFSLTIPLNLIDVDLFEAIRIEAMIQVRMIMYNI